MSGTINPYSYAFGDHTLFLRERSYPSLVEAYYSTVKHSHLYVYKGADHHLNLDACLGGELVSVFEFTEALYRQFNKHYMPGTPIRKNDLDFKLLERYVAKLIHRRQKESG